MDFASSQQLETPIYPGITVKLIGEKSSVKNVLFICEKAMKQAGLSKREIESFLKEAQAGSYNDLLVTCLRWFEVE